MTEKIGEKKQTRSERCLKKLYKYLKYNQVSKKTGGRICFWWGEIEKMNVLFINMIGIFYNIRAYLLGNAVYSFPLGKELVDLYKKIFALRKKANVL